MQVSVEDVSTVKKILRVEVPAQDVNEKLDLAYAELKKRARIKGFRPGKAPLTVLERAYGKEIASDVGSTIISESFSQAIQDKGLKIVGSPEIDPPELKKDSPFAYSATVEVLPVIGNVEFKGLSFSRKKFTAADKELDVQLELLRKNMAHLVPLEEDRPAQKGDFVLIDYEGVDKDSGMEELQRTEDFTLEIGSGKVVKDFEDQLQGMKKTEKKTIHVHFPDEYFNKNLAGKEVDFAVTLKDIRVQVLPELDDALAKDLGTYETLDELKKAIRSNLQAGYDRRSEQDLDEQIYKALLEKLSFEVPEVLVRHEIESMVSDSEKALLYRNMRLEDTGTTREQMAERYHPAALEQVKRYLVLDRIIEQESLSLSDEKLEAAYADMAGSLKQPMETVKKYYAKDPDHLEALKHTLLQKQAMDFVKENSTIQDVASEA